jgi:hypothetical protein
MPCYLKYLRRSINNLEVRAKSFADPTERANLARKGLQVFENRNIAFVIAFGSLFFVVGYTLKKSIKLFCLFRAVTKP